jgi:formylglycine-generating enzyme required for sulfatase activity/uncharacterized protein YjdB
MNKPSTSLLVGHTETLYAIIEPDNATNKNVTWNSSDTAIATVSSSGVVTGVKAGTATITVTTVDGNITASCTVTASIYAVAVTGVSLNKTSATLVVGGTEELTATITPSTATNQIITWISSNTTVAEVSAAGVVTAKNVGATIITVIANDSNKTAYCIVTVNPKVITFTVDAIPAQTYTGSAISPAVTVRDGSTALTLNTHYTVAYANNTNAGTAAVTVSGAGNYAGSSGSKTFTINPKVITFTIDAIPAQTYTGSAISPTVTVRDGSTVLTLTTHYTVTYSNNTNAGTATVTVSGAGNYAGSSGSRTYTINKAAGAAVSAPTLNKVTQNNIAINAVAAPANGQTVEYAKNTTDTAPSSGWQDGTTFSDLNANTAYYIFARSKENTNYSAGTPSTSLKVILVEMVYVPSGSFQMGKELGTDGSGDITPVHTVTLSSFYIGKYEVTQAQYQAVMGINPSSFSSNPASGEVQENRPVESVSWYDAIVFCNRLSIAEGLSPAYRISGSTNPSDWGTVPTNSDSTWNSVGIVAGSTGYRLPTEAQWEYAAKRGNYTYSGSNTVGDVAWYFRNSDYKTHEVGKKNPNSLGIYDMSGNVMEWCWDWRGDYSSGAQTDPQGAASGAHRIIRGGDNGYGGGGSNVVVVYRYYLTYYARYSGSGFRLVRP